MNALLICLSLVSVDPAADRDALLKTFREEFIAITPGTGKFPQSFVMGDASGAEASQSPSRTVTFRYSFHIAKYEVPQNLWEAVMGENPSRWKGKRNSVEMLSYAEAVSFCEKVTALMRAANLIKAGEVIRLPTEAEWEYTARAGTTTRYSFGDNVTELGAHAWFTGNAAGNDPPVGAKKPNAWGLYDVHGYLWEICADRWHENYNGAPQDGSAWIANGDKDRVVIRSGSWKDKAERLSSAFRMGLPADRRDDAVGLRCVLANQKSE